MLGKSKKVFADLFLKLQNISLLSLSFWIVMFLMNTFVVLVIFHNHYFEAKKHLLYLSILNDLLFASLVVWIFSVLFVFIPWKIARVLMSVLMTLTLYFQLVSLFYFNILTEALNTVVLHISSDQVSNTLSDFVIFKWYYLVILLPPFLFFKIHQKLKNYKISNWFSFLLFLPLLFGFYPLKHLYYNDLSFRDNSLVENKTVHFVRSVMLEFENKNEMELEKAIEIFQKNNAPKEFVSKEYPLLHKKINNNTLGKFFDLKETPPNIVFIIVESLSSTYSGKYAEEISFTPFLDSLANHSLAFHNFLAVAERTFGVLPSSLASLPHGENGFTMAKYNMPEHNSLPQYLFENGYYGAFFYGGYSRFDNMDLFVKNDGFKYIFDSKEYNYEGKDVQTTIDPVPFGNGDRLLFKNAMETHKSIDMKSPHLHVYLTLSMHYPYLTEDKEQYIAKVEELIKNHKSKKKISKYLDEFSTFLYTDDALKYFFETYKKQESYENTIFLIFGDHMFSEVPQRNEIEKYRVPFYIFSPLLNTNKDFFAVNSHLDIVPSFISLLDEKYQFKSPDLVHWLGSSLDTSSQFQSNKNFIIMRNNRLYEDFVLGNVLHHRNRAFSFDEKFNFDKIKNNKELEKISNIKLAFEKISKHTVANNLIIPSAKKYKVLYKEEHLPIEEISGETEFIGITGQKLETDVNSLKINLDIDFEEGIYDLAKKKLPVLVISIANDGKSKYWERIDLNEVLDEKNTQFHLEQIIQNNVDLVLKKDDEISLYFWNIEKSLDKFTIRKKLVAISTEIDEK
jgi:phosphoglycerol transferase MdoB-like AlkP superfamily enzyme